MRIIGSFETEKQAYTLYSFLLKEGIESIYEPAIDSKTHLKQYHVWVYSEDDLERAMVFLQKYQESPDDPLFQNIQIPLIAIPPPPSFGREAVEGKVPKWKVPLLPKFRSKRFALTLTHLILGVCIFLFLWNDLQEAELVRDHGPLAPQLVFTPLQESLIFDFPQAFQNYQEQIFTFSLKSYKTIKELPPEVENVIQQADHASSWKGAYDFVVMVRQKGWECAKQTPLFEKIREGQVWRLFTPCLLHKDFLHILFNMAWLWLLAKQIEQRMLLWKMALLLLIIGIASNIAQYLIGGPYFLGFSVVIVGMAGFIWMRQKKAPWEGYPLNKGTLLFLLLFVLSMFLLEIFTFGLELFSVINIAPTIANTAHIVGGLTGMFLGRLSFFGRGVP